MDLPAATSPAHADSENSGQRPDPQAQGAGGGGLGGAPPSGELPRDFGLPRRRRYFWRVALGCVIILLASAGGTAVFVLEQVHAVVHDISVNQPLKVSSHTLAHSASGQPETLLLVGDDTRSVFKYYRGYVPNLANEMLLIRIDPSKPWISMMSLPRELWVNVTEPNGATYTNRLNSAYTYGATTLLQTIRRVTGLSVNHMIATTFTRFERAINTLGCVYDTIDERYYHNNADGGAQYQNVNLEPGYQCLNGSQAEQFVSYRHTDTSQVRDARDQSFLLAAKAQYGPLFAGNIGKFERVFGRTVQTDQGLRSATEILNLANLVLSAEGLRVRQVHFQTDPCTVSCPVGDLTASAQQIHDSVHNFLFGGDRTPTRRVAAISRRIGGRHGLAHLPLTATLDANVAAERLAAARLQFTAEFPKVQDLAGSAIPVAAHCTELVQACIRSYRIRAPDGRAYPIYVEAFSNGDLGQFYDIQGTTWKHVPLLANPTQTVHVGGRSYELYYEGSHLETIAWHQYGGVYWVHNTLTDAVGNGELLGVAEQTAPVGAIRRESGHVILKAFSVPTPSTTTPTVHTSAVQSVGRVGGLIALVLLPLGLLLGALNWTRLRALRRRVTTATARAAVIETQLAATASGYRAVLAASGAADPQPFFDPQRPHRDSRVHQWWLSVAVTLGLAIAAAAAYVAIHSSTITHRPSRRPPSPTAAVAVLNAGQTPHAAHHLALALTHQHVHVVGVGNLQGSPPRSYEVFYRRHEARQGRLLAYLLKAEHPRVAPINAATTQAVGSKPRLVVVIP